MPRPKSFTANMLAADVRPFMQGMEEQTVWLEVENGKDSFTRHATMFSNTDELSRFITWLQAAHDYLRRDNATP